MSDGIILVTDPRSAKAVTLNLWESRKGNLFKDEQTARSDGATHVICKCGKLAKKPYCACPDCRHKAKVERYMAMPHKEIDNSVPVYSEYLEEYFSSISDAAERLDELIEDAIESGEDSDIDLMLVVCEQMEIPDLDKDWFTETFQNYIPEDSKLHPDIVQKLAELNAVIKKHRPEGYGKGLFRTSI